MSFGLETINDGGRTLITGSTFTVRAVIILKMELPKVDIEEEANRPTPPQTIICHKVKEGMFASCTPSNTYTPVTPPRPAFNPMTTGMAEAQMHSQGAQLPKVTCLNGSLVISAPITNGSYGGNFYIHIYEYL